MPADAAEVVSSNVVGYSKITMNADGYTLIANPFAEVGTGDLIGIDDMFSDDATEASSGTSIEKADNILVWTGSGYETYWYRKPKSGDAYWAMGNSRTTDSLPAGAGAFYLNSSSSSETLTISGEVRSESQTLTIAANGYSLLENPFPSPLDIQSFCVPGATAGTSIDKADNILVWTGNGYDTYWYRKPKSGAAYWAKGNSQTTDTIAPYTGFFYLSLGNESFTVTLQSPVASAAE